MENFNSTFEIFSLYAFMKNFNSTFGTFSLYAFMENFDSILGISSYLISWRNSTLQYYLQFRWSAVIFNLFVWIRLTTEFQAMRKFAVAAGRFQVNSFKWLVLSILYFFQFYIHFFGRTFNLNFFSVLILLRITVIL